MLVQQWNVRKMISEYDSTQHTKGKHRWGVDDQPNKSLRRDISMRPTARRKLDQQRLQAESSGEMLQA